MRFFLCMLFATAFSIASQAKAAEPGVRSAVQQVAAVIAVGADRHDWKRVRAAMADEITTDYTSLFGGKPATQPADQLVKNWAQFLPGFDSTHHMVGSLMVTNVEGDAVTAQANFTATHRIDKDLWVLGGRYDYRFVRASGAWRLSSLTMTALWETGDRGLVQLAAKRASEKK